MKSFLKLILYENLLNQTQKNTSIGHLIALDQGYILAIKCCILVHTLRICLFHLYAILPK